VCAPATGPDVAGSNLATFVDALSAIDRVAAKPADTSYAAILGTDAVIAGLHKGADGAEKTVDAKTISALLDNLSQIGNALSTISSNYTAYQKTRS
jgi:hypothetical protein